MNTVQTDDAPRAIGPYSQAIQVDGWLYASGQLPMTPAGDMVEGLSRGETMWRLGLKLRTGRP